MTADRACRHNISTIPPLINYCQTKADSTKSAYSAPGVQSATSL